MTSTSPIAPTRLAVAVVAMTGQLPFLGAIATDGIFYTVGAGAVSYGSDDGTVGVVAEAPISPATVAPTYSYEPGVAKYGTGPVISGYYSIAPFNSYDCMCSCNY